MYGHRRTDGATVASSTRRRAYPSWKVSPSRGVTFSRYFQDGVDVRREANSLGANSLCPPPTSVDFQAPTSSITDVCQADDNLKPRESSEAERRANIS